MLFICVNKIEITNIDPLLIFALIMIYGWYFVPLPYFCPSFYHDDAVMGPFDGALRIDGFHYLTFVTAGHQQCDDADVSFAVSVDTVGDAVVYDKDPYF